MDSSNNFWNARREKLEAIVVAVVKSILTMGNVEGVISRSKTMSGSRGRMLREATRISSYQYAGL